MRYQIPQFVDIEDKIIGPFTLKQFLIYFAAVLVLIPVYLASDLSLFITIALPTLGMAALFAHFRVHGRTLAQVLASGFRFYTHSNVYIWRRTETNKPIVIHDKDWQEEIINGGLGTEEALSLHLVAQKLETAGSVVVAEAVEDPMDMEEIPNDETRMTNDKRNDETRIMNGRRMTKPE